MGIGRTTATMTSGVVLPSNRPATGWHILGRTRSAICWFVKLPSRPTGSLPWRSMDTVIAGMCHSKPKPILKRQQSATVPIAKQWVARHCARWLSRGRARSCCYRVRPPNIGRQATAALSAHKGSAHVAGLRCIRRRIAENQRLMPFGWAFCASETNWSRGGKGLFARSKRGSTILRQFQSSTGCHRISRRLERWQRWRSPHPVRRWRSAICARCGFDFAYDGETVRNGFEAPNR